MRQLRYFVLIIGLIFISSVLAQENTETPTPRPTLPPINADNIALVNAFIQMDNNQPLVGEPFTMTLIVETPLDVEIIEWLTFDEEEPLQIIDAGDVERTEGPENISYRQVMTVVLWDFDDYNPELYIVYQVNSQHWAEPVQITETLVVPRLLENPDEELLDPDIPQIYLGFLPIWTIVAVIVGVLAGVLAIFMILRIIFRSVGRSVAGTPALTAIGHLEDIMQQNLPSETAYPLIAATLRDYLRTYYAIEAGELTTSELCDMLYERDVFDKEQFKRFQYLLEDTDLVKFANFDPSVEDRNSLIQSAIQWLRDDERIENMKKATADDQ